MALGTFLDLTVWLREHGGSVHTSEARIAGFSDRDVAQAIAAGIHIRQQVWIDGHPIDAVVGKRLLIQLDGFAHHSNPRDRRRDLRDDARLALRGYTVLRFDYLQVMHQPQYVIDTVRSALAQGVHLAR